MAKRSRSVALAALKVTGRVLYEKVARPPAYRLDEVPYSPYAITPQWLTAAICSGAPGAIVTSIAVEDVSAGTQARHRLRVTYNQAGCNACLPATIFTKSLPSIVTRMVAGFNGHARTEGNFYSQLRPQLNIEAPTCYYSTYDKRTFAAVHLLEDLVATKSATFCGHTTQVTRSMADDMVDLLATLHGRFYQDQTLRERCRWLADYPRWFTIGAEKMRTEHYTQKAFDAAKDIIPPALMARRAEIWPATMRALAVHATEPVTLLHSDVHIGNWYQTGAGRMGLCDWQCPSIGHWSRDFAYAITAALTPDDRRKWERELLARYIEKLAGHCAAQLDFEQSWKHYRQQVLHALAMWTITLCHSPLLPSMQPVAMTRTMLERITVAADDLQSLDAG
jgi:aminoglycoside phosphotransferase (APT) family kinase protein